MKALVIRGRLKGKEVKISQWCNDWFTLDTGEWQIDRIPMSPSSLAFTVGDSLTLQKSKKQSGILFQLFSIQPVTFGVPPHLKDVYVFTFVRRTR